MIRGNRRTATGVQIGGLAVAKPGTLLLLSAGSLGLCILRRWKTIQAKLQN